MPSGSQDGHQDGCAKAVQRRSPSDLEKKQIYALNRKWLSGNGPVLCRSLSWYDIDCPQVYSWRQWDFRPTLRVESSDFNAEVLGKNILTRSKLNYVNSTRRFMNKT